MTDPPDRFIWFYDRHQPDLFCSLTQEIPDLEFYEGIPTNTEVMFDRSKHNICIIDDLMQSASGNQLVENLFTNGRHLNLSVIFVSQNLFYSGKKCRTISLNSICIMVFKNPRNQTHISAYSMSDVPFEAQILTSSIRKRNKRSL